MTPAAAAAENARDRLLAGAELLDEAQGGEVSTRAICDRAGVQAPTLYHLLWQQAGAARRRAHPRLRIPRQAGRVRGGRRPAGMRTAWDLHVRFGVENPNFYMLIYGRARPGLRRRRRRRGDDRRGLEARRPPPSPARAAPAGGTAILAASTGVVLTLITQPRVEVDFALSDQVRDAILDAGGARGVGCQRRRRPRSPSRRRSTTSRTSR